MCKARSVAPRRAMSLVSVKLDQGTIESAAPSTAAYDPKWTLAVAKAQRRAVMGI